MSYCANCGAKLPENAKFCPECGQKIEYKSNQERKVIYSAKAENIKVIDENDSKALNDKYTEVTSEKKKRNLSKSDKIALVFSLVLTFGLIIIFVGGSGSTGSQQTQTISKEDYIAQCANYFYEDISRDPDDYKGNYAVFTGQVIQVMESGNNITLRVNVTRNATFTDEEIAENPYIDEDDNYIWWEDTIYVTYKMSDGESRILEDDIVTIYGQLDGIETYTAVLGNEISIPKLNAKYIDLNED